MRGSWVFQIGSIAALLASCDKNGCGGATCPFTEPTHHAVVNGVVLDLNDHPLAGIYTSVAFAGQVYSGVGTQTNQMGQFTATARADISPGAADTVSAWVRATQANPPPAAVVTDSVRVLLRFKPRTDPPVVVETSIHLPVTP